MRKEFYLAGMARSYPSILPPPGSSPQPSKMDQPLSFLLTEKHWHGAMATTAMTHIAIYEELDGKSAEWMEKVSDKQYNA